MTLGFGQAAVMYEGKSLLGLSGLIRERYNV
jgi:hypothetical protein